MIRRIKHKTLLAAQLFIVALSIQKTQAQVTSVEEIRTTFDYLRDSVPYHKIYLSTDKPFYLDTDTIRFQTYLTESTSGLLKNGKSIGYIALLDGKNTILNSIKVRIVDGLATGFIALPSDIKTDRYFLVAYTQSMKNYSPDFYFNKEILIFEGCRQTEEDTEQGHITVSFYPEGGNFAEGQPNHIGVEILDHDRNPVQLTCSISNQSNDLNIPVSTDRNGLSVFNLNHKMGDQYTFSFTVDGQEQQIPLPTFSNNTLSVRMKSMVDHIEVNLNLTEKFRYTNEQLYLFFHHASRLIYSQSIRTNDEGILTSRLAYSEIPNGLGNLVILDKDFNLIAERLFYVDKKSALFDASLSIEQQEYDPRETVSINLDLSKVIGKSKTGKFSVSVFDKKMLNYQSQTESGIKAYHFLCSELNDRINNPNYYFSETGKEKINDMLIAKSGTRVDWESLLSKQGGLRKKQIEKDNAFLSISGKIINKTTGQPAPAKTQINFLLPENQEILEARCNVAGEVFQNLYFDYFKPKQYYYNISNSEEPLSFVLSQETPVISKNHLFGKKSKFPSVNIPFSVPTIPCDDFLLSYQKRSWVSEKLNSSYDFYLSDTTTNQLLHSTPTENIKKFPSDLHLNLDDYVPFSSMHIVVKEIINNVSIRIKKKEEMIRVFSEEIKHTFDNSPLFIIDNFPTFDKEVFLDLAPKNIQYIDVISSVNYLSKYGNLGRNGVIIVTSKNSQSSIDPYQDAIIRVSGFQKNKSTKESQKVTNSAKPDFRPLIYWSPLRDTDNLGYDQIKFNHSNDLSQFIISIEGTLLENGELFKKTIEYSVQPN